MLNANLLTSPITDPAIVTQLIPQRAPFIMIDKLLFFSHEMVTAGLTVGEDNLFTRNATFTEPGLIEHMAQSVAAFTGYRYFIKNEPAPVGYLGSIKNVEIQSLPHVGDELRTTVNVLHEIMGVVSVRISTRIGEQEIAIAEMKTVIAK